MDECLNNDNNSSDNDNHSVGNDNHSVGNDNYNDNYPDYNNDNTNYYHNSAPIKAKKEKRYTTSTSPETNFNPDTSNQHHLFDQ